MQYGIYEIESEQIQPSLWVAHVRRIDGKTISGQPFGAGEVPVLTTKPYYTKDFAIEAAKAIVDTEVRINRNAKI